MVKLVVTSLLTGEILVSAEVDNVRLALMLVDAVVTNYGECSVSVDMKYDLCVV